MKGVSVSMCPLSATTVLSLGRARSLTRMSSVRAANLASMPASTDADLLSQLVNSSVGPNSGAISDDTLAAQERIDKFTWRGPGKEARYFNALEAWGYTLAPVEEIARGEKPKAAEQVTRRSTKAAGTTKAQADAKGEAEKGKPKWEKASA